MGLAIVVLAAMVVVMLAAIAAMLGQVIAVVVVLEPIIETMVKEAAAAIAATMEATGIAEDSGGQRLLRRGKKARRQKQLGCGDWTAVLRRAETVYRVCRAHHMQETLMTSVVAGRRHEAGRRCKKVEGSQLVSVNYFLT